MKTMRWNLHWLQLICLIATYGYLSASHATLPPYVTGDILAGKEKASACVACHNADGNSSNPAWPKIAGLDPDYALKQLYAFQKDHTGCRSNPLMKAIVTQLTDDDLINLAAYFGSKIMSPGYAEPEPLTLGEQLYRGGDRQRGITACMACHGPRGRGLASAKTPHIAGQHAEYLASQLRAYQNESRCSDPNETMRKLAARLTNEEILAVANYIQGLY